MGNDKNIVMLIQCLNNMIASDDTTKNEYTATVVKYVDGIMSGTATGSFDQIIKEFEIDKPQKNVYFKLMRFNDVSYDYVNEVHFGCSCKKRGGLSITEGIYCNAYLNNQFKRRLDIESFRLLVRFYLFFKQATQKKNELENLKFQQWVSAFFDKWENVDDLNVYAKRSGIYALILGEYSKCYIGQAIDIKKRILEHWKRDNFNTKGIDLFRAKDTTQIFVLPVSCKVINQNEYDYVNQIPKEFRLNQLCGGSIKFHEENGLKSTFQDNEVDFLEYWKQQRESEKQFLHFFDCS